MKEIKCDECGQIYYVSSLWLIDDKKRKTYCHKCGKETTFTIIKGLTIMDEAIMNMSLVKEI